MKKILTVLCSFILITAISSSVFAKEGQSDSYWGNIPEDTTFAFVDSRYYDGTDYVKVFNVGFYLGDSGEYYTNGDWTDLTNVYRREDYYKNQESIDYTNNATPGQEPRPEGYPTNDVGGDADGKLSSYNAGTYTTLSWSNFSMFGRRASQNYDTSGVTNVSNVQTYVEIWKVDPELNLEIDKEKVNRGDTFTVILSIENHFNNMEGLPTSDEVIFTGSNAIAVSEVKKEDNKYYQTFKATEDLDVQTIDIKAEVSNAATNYNPKEINLNLNLPETYNVSYKFINGTNNDILPEEITSLLPTDNTKYESGSKVTAIQPTETTINTTDGIWTFKGYELSEIEKITEDSEFIGIWEFTENADTNMNQTNVDNGDTDNHKPNNDEKNDNNMITNVNTGDSSNLILWSIISIVSVLGILVTIIIKYKKINNH